MIVTDKLCILGQILVIFISLHLKENQVRGEYCTYFIKLLPVSELVFSLGCLSLGPAAGESELEAVAVRCGRLRHSPPCGKRILLSSRFVQFGFHMDIFYLKMCSAYLGFMMANASAVVTDSIMKTVFAILLKSQWAVRGLPLMAVWAEARSLL